MLKRGFAIVVLGMVAGGLTGCLERQLTITSDPPGATVTVNDVEVGRTPVTASFAYYGKFEVDLEREGCEPLRTKAKASAPLYEYPPFDLFAAALPVNVSTDVRWHFKLDPELSTVESQEVLEKGLLERAGSLRQQVK